MKRKCEIEKFDEAIRILQKEFPHLCIEMDRDHLPHYAQAEIRQQPGLSFDVLIDLQNLDELFLTAGSFWVSWFPCGDKQVFDRFIEAVRGVLSGAFRIVERRIGPFPAFTRLQRPAGHGGWEVVASCCTPWALLPWPRKERILQNLPRVG